MINDNFKMSDGILWAISAEGYDRLDSRDRQSSRKSQEGPSSWQMMQAGLQKRPTRNNYAAPEIREAGRREEKHRRAQSLKN